MNESDAKYKVYMHQDVLILNNRFLFDILDIFLDDEVGMIGVIGSKKLPGSCKWWDSDEKLGGIIDVVFGNERSYGYGNIKGQCEEAAAVDGLLLVTQYDLKWRDDLFTGWHCYDSSQCFEFRRNNYKVVVPKQRGASEEILPWCLHHSAAPSLEIYDLYCPVFRKEYWDMIDCDILLELGCGNQKTEGYLGIDRFDLPGVDIVSDLNQGIPLRDNTVSRVYASHSLEHLDDLTFIMGEIYRVCEHEAIVTIYAPYYLQSTNLSNPYHKHVFLETTFQAYTTAKTTLIDSREYAIPSAPFRGIGESDNSECNMDFRCLRMDFNYLPEYYLYSDDELRTFRKSRLNVCEMILYNLVVVKDTFSLQDEQRCLQNAFIPPLFDHIDSMRKQAIQKAEAEESK
jgi:hypothetical protein